MEKTLIFGWIFGNRIFLGRTFGDLWDILGVMFGGFLETF